MTRLDRDKPKCPTCNYPVHYGEPCDWRVNEQNDEQEAESSEDRGSE